MMMRAQALLEKNPAPTELEIRRYLTPNLCRCGTHMRIIRAVLRAAQLMQSTAPATAARP
jgi:nicotinate dehydrogenase subunit A